MEYSEALKLLNLNENFSDKELKKAYLKMSKVYHPDLNGDEEMMKKINEARDVLINGTSIHVYKSSFNYHEELVNRLKVKLAYASVDDINYKRIDEVIKEFMDIDITSKRNIDLYQEFIKVESKIMDIYFEIKREFYKVNKIPKSFICTINFTGSLIDLYNDLNEVKKMYYNYICKNIVINSVVKNNIDNKYYVFLKEKIELIVNSVCDKYFDSKETDEIINIVNMKVNYMYVLYEDALNVINNIYSIIDSNNLNELRISVDKEINAMNKDYYTNYGRLNEILVSVGFKYNNDLRKNIKVKEFICNKYMDSNLLRQMLLDINYINIGLISKEVIDIMLKREYKDVIEYNNIIFNKLNNNGVIYINNKLISSGILSLGLITYKDINKVYVNGIQYNKAYFFNYYETIELFLREAEFIGELVNNNEVLLYTNNVSAIYLVEDKIEVRLFDKCRGLKINHIDIVKYKDKLLLRDVILNNLVNDVNYTR